MDSIHWSVSCLIASPHAGFRGIFLAHPCGEMRMRPNLGTGRLQTHVRPDLFRCPLGSWLSYRPPPSRQYHQSLAAPLSHLLHSFILWSLFFTCVIPASSQHLSLTVGSVGSQFLSVSRDLRVMRPSALIQTSLNMTREDEATPTCGDSCHVRHVRQKNAWESSVFFFFLAFPSTPRQ